MVLALATSALVVAVAVSGSAYSNKAEAPNPDDGLTDAQKVAAHQADFREFWVRYESWLKDLGPDVNLRALPMSDLLASGRGGAPSLAEAAAGAQRIVRGRIDGVEFQPGPVALVHLAVATTIKGPAASKLDMVIPCMLTPSDDWQLSGIACADAVPMLYPGDEVILLLERASEKDPFSIQPWTGAYWIDGESVKAVAGNGFRAEVERMGATQLLQQLSK